MPIESKENIEAFIEAKKLYDETVNKGLQSTSIRQENSYIGIYNRGSTCYLNTLLQSLYHDITFRNAIYNAVDDSSIILEFQRFFGNLELSNYSAINSIDLINSFGWSKAQSHEQHDIYELFNVLIEALCKSSNELENNLKQIFEGKYKDTLTCPDCSHQHTVEASFNTISLEVPDELESNNHLLTSLESLIKSHLTPETLDENNKWECNKCNNKVQALKTLEYTKLPNTLVIHLKRTRFDPTTKRRRKLTTKVFLPDDLPNQLLISHDNNNYKLHSILIHTGNAMGGHYRAFIRCNNFSSNQSLSWYDFNDANVTLLSSDEINNMFNHTTTNPLLHENAYILIYKKIDDMIVNNYVSTVPISIKEEIIKSNEELIQIQKYLNIKNNLLEFIIYYEPLNNDIINDNINNNNSYSYYDTGSETMNILNHLYNNKNIILSINNPLMQLSNPSNNIEYDIIIEVTSSMLISEVITIISNKINLSSDKFYLKRYQNGPLFKDLNKSVGDYGLVTMGILHVQLGKGCNIGEYLLHFDLDITDINQSESNYPKSHSITSISSVTLTDSSINSSIESTNIKQTNKGNNSRDYISFGDIAIPEKFSILQVKQYIFDNWDNLISNIPNDKIVNIKPKSPLHIRLRDNKSGLSNSYLSTLLRNDRIIIRCLLGLVDGRKLIIEILQNEEIISSDDLLITIILLNYSNKLISNPIDIPISRDITIVQWNSLIIEKYNNWLQNNKLSTDSNLILEVAKVLTNGPPLTLKSSIKYKWISYNTLLDSDNKEDTIDRPPLSLRDGSIITIRNNIEYEEVKSQALAKRNQSIEGNTNLPVGSGVAAVKANRPSSSTNIARIRALSSQGKRNKKENGISIEVFSKDNSNSNSSNNENVNNQISNHENGIVINSI